MPFEGSSILPTEWQGSTPAPFLTPCLDDVAPGGSHPVARLDLQRTCPADLAGGRQAMVGLTSGGTQQGYSCRSPVQSRVQDGALACLTTTTTGHEAWWTQCMLTEPSSMPLKPPCPLVPTTSRSADLERIDEDRC